MANVEHSDLAHAEAHEPKHISINGTGQSGQVITNSSSSAGVSEYRTLKPADMDEFDRWITHIHPNGTTTETHFLVTPIAGEIVDIVAIIDNPVTGADQIYTFAVDGVNITPATMTFTLAGSAQGEVQTLTPSSGATLALNSSIEITGNGGNTDANLSTYFVFTIRA